jgi:hypothetical protein
MQQVATLELLRRAIRFIACTRCHNRTHDGRSFAPHVARPCEVECTIFANLPKLAKIAHDHVGDRCAPMERQMQEQICLNCHAHRSSSDDCDRRVNRECPLSIYLLDVIEPIERILEMRSRSSRV